MDSSSNKLQSVSKFFTKLVSNAVFSLQSQKDEFYQNILNFDTEKESIHRKGQDNIDVVKQKDQNRNQNLCIVISSQFIAEKNLQNQQITQNMKTKNTQIQEPPNISKSKFKINPRLSKLSKISKIISKATSPQHSQLSLQNKSQSKQKFASQIKQITLKKLQLKNKLRKLNSQLQKQKHSYFSFQAYQQDLNQSRTNPEEQSLLAKLKNSSLVSNNPLPSFNFSRLKSKSDAQFNLKRQSLKDKQAVYSPEKHEAAFKLIQKMHSQKLKKHQKILNDMKKKQQKQIETVRRLQIERKKQKQQKIKRQKVLLTPNFINTASSNSNKYFSFSDRRKAHSKSQRSVLDISLRQKQRQINESVLKQKVRKRTPTECIQQDSQEENRLTELLKNKNCNNDKNTSVSRKPINQLENQFLA